MHPAVQLLSDSRKLRRIILPVTVEGSAVGRINVEDHFPARIGMAGNELVEQYAMQHGSVCRAGSGFKPA